MNLQSRAEQYEATFGFPWELIIALAIEVITEWCESREQFVGERNVTRMQSAVLGWRIRRLAREDGLRVPVSKVRDKLIADYYELTEEQAGDLWDEVERCCGR